MPTEKPLVDKEYLLERFPGKGGWTYALIPEIAPNRKSHFSWVRVKGSIDSYPLKKFKLMPMGNGQMFLPVKTEIRKKIGKAAGDHVWVTLYPDETPVGITEEIMECFQNEPDEALQRFEALNAEEQKTYLDWIYDAKDEEVMAHRIMRMMDRLLQR